MEIALPNGRQLIVAPESRRKRLPGSCARFLSVVEGQWSRSRQARVWIAGGVTDMPVRSRRKMRCPGDEIGRNSGMSWVTATMKMRKNVILVTVLHGQFDCKALCPKINGIKGPNRT